MSWSGFPLHENTMGKAQKKCFWKKGDAEIHRGFCTAYNMCFFHYVSATNIILFFSLYQQVSSHLSAQSATRSFAARWVSRSTCLDTATSGPTSAATAIAHFARWAACVATCWPTPQSCPTPVRCVAASSPKPSTCAPTWKSTQVSAWSCMCQCLWVFACVYCGVSDECECVWLSQLKCVNASVCVCITLRLCACVCTGHNVCMFLCVCVSACTPVWEIV